MAFPTIWKEYGFLLTLLVIAASGKFSSMLVILGQQNWRSDLWKIFIMVIQTLELYLTSHLKWVHLFRYKYASDFSGQNGR